MAHFNWCIAWPMLILSCFGVVSLGINLKSFALYDSNNAQSKYYIDIGVQYNFSVSKSDNPVIKFIDSHGKVINYICISCSMLAMAR